MNGQQNDYVLCTTPFQLPHNHLFTIGIALSNFKCWLNVFSHFCSKKSMQRRKYISDHVFLCLQDVCIYVPKIVHIG